MTYGLWFIVLGSTLSWAVFDVVRKKMVKRVPVLALAFWISVVQLPGYIVWMAIDGRWQVDAGYVLPATASMAVNLLANVLFLESVRRGPLSVAIPVLSFTPVFVALGGMPILGERLNLAQWLGVSIVTGGSVFLTAEPGMRRKPIELVAQFARSPGVAPMFGVAILWSLSPLFDKLALRHAGVGLHGVMLALSGAIGMGLYLLARGQGHTLALPSRTKGFLALGGLSNVAALGLQLVAISSMVVSVFEAFKRAAGVFIALLLGAALFHETVGRTRAFAAAFMATGVVLVLRG